MYEYVRVVKTVGKRKPPLHTPDKKFEQVSYCLLWSIAFRQVFLTFLVSRPFPSCPKPLFLNKAKEEALHMKIILFSSFQSNSFSKEMFALSLGLKMRTFGTPKMANWNF